MVMQRCRDVPCPHARHRWCQARGDGGPTQGQGDPTRHGSIPAVGTHGRAPFVRGTVERVMVGTDLNETRAPAQEPSRSCCGAPLGEAIV